MLLVIGVGAGFCVCVCVYVCAGSSFAHARGTMELSARIGLHPAAAANTDREAVFMSSF